VPQDNPRAFLGGFVAIALTMGLSVLAFNVVVDPFWRFDLVTIQGVNAQRSQFASWARLAKAGVVCRVQPTSLIMGTSRAEEGLDPRHPGWQSIPGSTYNLALAGTGLEELYLTFQHAVHASPGLRRVVMALDFLMFNANREAVVFGTEVQNFDAKRLLLSAHDSCLHSFLYDANQLIGLRGLAYDFATIKAQMPDAERHDADKMNILNWVALSDRDGFRGNNFDILAVLAQRKGMRYFTDDVSGRNAGQEAYYTTRVWRPPPDERYCFSREGRPNTFDVFRNIVRFARQSGTDISFVINPIHARMLIALQEDGLWPQYEDWKRGLVDVIAQEAEQDQATAFPVWDFSGFNSVTTEAIPPLDDHETLMKWYWEPSHYRKEAGDMILDRVLRYRDPQRQIPDDFGRELTSSNIESWLATTREGARTYAKTQPNEVEIVQDRLRPIMADSEGANCGFDVEALHEASDALHRGDHAAAEIAILHAVAIHEADRKRFAELGVPYRETGFDAALAEARAGHEIPRSLANWEAYQTRANERVALGDLKGAIDDFSRAIRIAPPNTALYYLRGITRLKVGAQAAAVEDFQAALQIDPQNPVLRYLLKGTSAEIGPRVTPVDTAAAVAFQQKADTKRTKGDLPGAIKDYGEAIRVGPPNTALYYLRGTALLELGNPSAASEDFETGLKLDPVNTTLLRLRDQARLMARPAASRSSTRDPTAVELQR
jgi:tetratricopeptide (TPR) repeat protein